MRTKTVSQRDIAAEPHVGERYVNRARIESELMPGRRLASLPEARSITEKGWYWISAEGVPTKEGYYRDNKDGTFTKLNANEKIPEWFDRVYVSKDAAAQASRGEGPLAVCVWESVFASGRLDVVSSDRPDDVARIASMPQVRDEPREQALEKSKRR